MNGRELASLRQRWDRYQHLTELTEHWYWRPGWRTDRQFYTWHVTFQDQPELHQLVTTLQGELEVPGLDLVPLDGLHLTMQGLGFSDEVAREDVAAIVAEVQRRCLDLPPLELSLGPVDADEEGIGLLVQPWDRVERLRDVIRAAIGDVWGKVPEPAGGFRPHVTIAYSGGAVSAAPVRARLANLRSLASVNVRISEVPLIALRREGRVYRWNEVAQVPLGRQ